MFTRHCLEVLWHYCQLTLLFLDLNMPAILDYVSDLQAASYRHATYPCDCGCKNRFSLYAAIRLLSLYLPHKPATTAAGACCRKYPTQAVWIKDF